MFKELLCKYINFSYFFFCYFSFCSLFPPCLLAFSFFLSCFLEASPIRSSNIFVTWLGLSFMSCSHILMRGIPRCAAHSSFTLSTHSLCFCIGDFSS